MSEQKLPAPYDWHDAMKFKPIDGEIVVVRNLWPGWARCTNGVWTALDECGNRHPLQWTPEFWRRQYFPEEPTP